MIRTVAVLAILFISGLPPAFGDPQPAPAAQQSPTAAQNSTADNSTHENSASQAPALATTAAAAATPATAATPSKLRAPAETMEEKELRNLGYKPSMRNGTVVYCRREIPLGSRLPTTLKCVTTDEAELIAREGRETTERIQRGMSGCIISSTQHGPANCGN